MADDYGSSVGAPNLGTVAIGGSTNGNREAANDQDWFRVTLTAGTSYIFRMDGITLPDPTLSLLDPNGVAIPGAGNDDANGSTFNSEFRFTASVSGTYFLRASSPTGNETGTYTVSAAIDPNPPGQTDDFGAQAGAPNLGSVAIGGSTTGNLETAGDSDWFAVTLTAGTAYIFRQELITQGDPLLRLRDSNGVPITSNDDGGGGLDSQISFTAPTSGTYYLEANTATQGDTGTYRVSAAINGAPPPPPVDDFGAQAGAGNLGSLTVGSTSTGTLEVAGDRDWFAVTLSAGSQYRFRQEAGTLVDPRFTLRDGIGNPITGDDDSGGGNNAQLDFTATSSGVFYIDANSADAGGTGTYTVRATLLYGAPVIVNNTGSTAAEGGADTITASELSTTDPDSAAAAIVYTLTSVTTNGTLTRNGTAVGVAGTFTQADINSGLVVYTHNGSETTGGNFGFSVSDGTTNLTNRTFNIAVTPGNDAPQLGDPTAASIAYSAMVPLLQGVTLADPDAPANLAGGGFTLAVGGNGGAIDLRASSNFSVVGPNLIDTVSGLAIGTIAGLGTQSVTVSALTSNAGLAVVERAIQAFGFELAFVGAAGNRTVTLTLNDGGNTGSGGALSDSVTQIVTVPFNFISRTTNSGETITGTAEADFIQGGNGNDVLLGLASDDRLYGELGNDRIATGAGNDIAYGGDGSDTVDYSTAVGSVYVDLLGNFALETALTTGTVLAGTAQLSKDQLYTIENVIGSAFGDRIYGGAGDTIVTPGAGADIVYGRGGVNTIDYSVASGAVFIDLSGRFVLETALTTGTVLGTTPFTTLDYVFDFANATGSAFGDRLYGTAGVNMLSGGDGSDYLYGMAGDDTLLGGAGDDLLVGGSGTDTLTGGAGADQFYFSSTADGTDTLTDFLSAEDDLYFLSSAFEATAVLVSSGSGPAGGAAFFYDQASGALSYSVTGVEGAGVAVLTLAPNTILLQQDLVFYT